MTDIIPRHKTAIRRKNASMPCRWLMENEEPSSILDYGCGHGRDVQAFLEEGWEALGYDPHFFPTQPNGRFDWVLCSYVLNVIEDPSERKKVIADLNRLGTKVLIVVRHPKNIPTENGTSFSDGILTRTGTFQKGFGPKELQNLVGPNYKVWKHKHAVFALKN